MKNGPSGPCTFFGCLGFGPRHWLPCRYVRPTQNARAHPSTNENGGPFGPAVNQPHKSDQRDTLVVVVVVDPSSFTTVTIKIAPSSVAVTTAPAPTPPAPPTRPCRPGGSDVTGPVAVCAAAEPAIAAETASAERVKAIFFMITIQGNIGLNVPLQPVSDKPRRQFSLAPNLSAPNMLPICLIYHPLCEDITKLWTDPLPRRPHHPRRVTPVIIGKTT